MGDSSGVRRWGGGALAVALVVLGAEPARADGPVTWTGADGGAWSDPANWSTGAVPTSADDVVVHDHRVRVTGAVRVASLDLAGPAAALEHDGAAALDVKGELTWRGGELDIPTTAASARATGPDPKRIGTTSSHGCSDAGLTVAGPMLVQGPVELTAADEPLQVGGLLTLDNGTVSMAHDPASRCGADPSTRQPPVLDAPDLALPPGTNSTVAGALEAHVHLVQLGDGSRAAALLADGASLVAPALRVTGLGTLAVGRPTAATTYGGTLGVLGGAVELGAGTVLRLTAAYGYGDGGATTVVRAPDDGAARGGVVDSDRSKWEGAITFAAGPTSAPEHEVDLRLAPNSSGRASFGVRSGVLSVGSDLAVPGGAVLSTYPERAVLSGHTVLGPVASDGARPVLNVEPGGLVLARAGTMTLLSNAAVEGSVSVGGVLDLRARTLEIASKAGGARAVLLRGTLRTTVARSGSGGISGRYADLSLGGRLVVARASGYQPAAGAHWPLAALGGGAAQGAFAGVSGSPGSGLRYVVQPPSSGVGTVLRAVRA